ncbi:MAG: hypothetical protein WBA93_08835 [Microcoleaceae cyanobacterium]
MSLIYRIKPKQTFVITLRQIANYLGISPDRILRWEKWPYLLWVNIKGRGGYFVSYRKLQQWITACRHLISRCRTIPALNAFWSALQKESGRYTAEGIYRLRSFWQQQQTHIHNYIKT